MGYKDTLNQRLIAITYSLKTEQILKARENRNWDKYDKLDEVGKLQYQLEEFSIYESLLEDLTEEDVNNIMTTISNSRFK